MRSILRYFFLLCMVSCSPSVDYDTYLSDEESTSVMSILSLKESYVSGLQLLSDDVVVSGIITANNIAGEFEYSIIIEDDSGAIEVALDQSSGVGRYLLGSRLTLYCGGLYMVSDGGSMMLGCEPSLGDDYLVSEIDEDDMLERSTITTQESLKEPRVVTIGGLEPTLSLCYVAIEGVTILPADTGGTVCARDEDTGRFVSTTHEAVDGDGNTIRVYVPSTVIYAGMSITSSQTTLYGIVDLYNGYYSMRLVCGYISLMNM